MEPDSSNVQLGFRAVSTVGDEPLRVCDRSSADYKEHVLQLTWIQFWFSASSLHPTMPTRKVNIRAWKIASSLISSNPKEYIENVLRLSLYPPNILPILSR